MPYFKAKVHQIRFRLKLRGAPTEPLAGFERVLLLRQRTGKTGREERKGQERGRKKRKENSP